ncbi:MAG: L,D-transpeptidase family protein [Hyphomicrobiaceae bacterium]|nr:L,D-transpeptidase family protein [Hyphomicrobiaceae bacterium]
MRLSGLALIAVLGSAATTLAPHGPANAIEPDAPERLLNASDVIGLNVRRLLETNSAVRAEAEDRAALTAAYAARANAPLWIDEAGFTTKARAVMAELRAAADWGLDPRQFTLPDDPGGSLDPNALAAAETTLSLAVLTYARHARGGRIPEPSKQLSSYLDRKPVLKDPAEVIDEIATTSDPAAYLRALHPSHRQFHLLRQALVTLRGGGTAAKPDEPEAVRLPQDGPTLLPGKRHPDVALLRQRLTVEAAAGEQDVYDEALREAVIAFQAANGLNADGLVGRGTRTALNGDTAAQPVRESAILAAMEQWRWMPEDLGAFHIEVNIPEYSVRVISGNEVVHAERIIVGQTNNQTPVFSDQMETVVFQPFWGVPDSIKVNEILPAIARGGSGALARQGLRLQYNGRDVDATQVDWSSADIRNYHVYQPPGRSNVLGEVKFLFPNQHQTYMHDTPTKNLFNSSVRTFSHGCMRVRNPLKLAEAVLSYDKGWSKQMVDQALQDGPENNQVVLDRKIPVHMIYMTVVAAEDGSLKTFPDVYGHEKRITLALAGRFNEIDRGRDHLAPVQLKRPQVFAQPGYGNSGPINNIFQAIFGF